MTTFRSEIDDQDVFLALCDDNGINPDVVDRIYKDSYARRGFSFSAKEATKEEVFREKAIAQKIPNSIISAYLKLQ